MLQQDLPFVNDYLAALGITLPHVTHPAGPRSGNSIEAVKEWRRRRPDGLR
jgi:hypothetical protein